MSKCQVFNCENVAEYFNPDSGLKYCEECKTRLGGRIIYQSHNPKTGIKEISTRLLKIPLNEPKFDLMDRGD